jgi:hypothetical protein
MNILDAILNAQDGAAVQQLGSQVGLGPNQATATLSTLMPALAGGLQRNMQSQGRMESLMRALSSANHGHYIDNPTSLAEEIHPTTSVVCDTRETSAIERRARQQSRTPAPSRMGTSRPPM